MEGIALRQAATTELGDRRAFGTDIAPKLSLPDSGSGLTGRVKHLMAEVVATSAAKRNSGS